MGLNFIVEKKARRAAFRRRSSGLLKKAEELSILCDVDVCLFIVGDGNGDGAIDGVHWPTSPSELQRIVGLYHSSHNAMIKKKKGKKGKKNQQLSASHSQTGMEMEGIPSMREDLKSAISEVRERIDHLLLQREMGKLSSSSSSALQVQEGLDDGNSSGPQSLNLDHDFDGSSGEGFDDGKSSWSQNSNLESQALQSSNLGSHQALQSLNLGIHQPLPMPMVQHLQPICSMPLGNRINDDDFNFFSQLPALSDIEAEVDNCTDEIACSSSSLDYIESNSLYWSNSLNNAADQDPVLDTEPSNEFAMMQTASFFPRFLSAHDDAISTIPSTGFEMMDVC